MSRIKVKLHPKQYEVLKDEHRFKVICAGRRFGKSVLARMIVLGWATESPGMYYIVSPTYRQSKEIHWRDFQNEVPRKWVKRKNETELSIELQNGSIIAFKGAENPDSLRGVKLRGLVIDEIASIRNWDWLWKEVLRPTLTDYQSPAIFISTPKGYNHFYELFKLGEGVGDSSNSAEYKSWRFTSYDNPHIPKQEIDNAKQELTEDTFAQEYMADFRKHTGLVYKEFDRDIHVIDPFDVPEHWRIYRGLDFGSTNPTVCLWVAVDDDDNMFVVDEHYESGQTIDYHAGIINANPYSSRVEQTYGDPSGAQWINEFAQRGIYITPADKETGTSHSNWVRFGIEKVAERIKPKPGHSVSIPGAGVITDGPRIYFTTKCPNTINEAETYRWKEKSVTQAQDLNEPDVPEKANDHTMDALRYIVVSKPEASAYDDHYTPTYTPSDSIIGI